jgi:hypothetical protein
MISIIASSALYIDILRYSFLTVAPSQSATHKLGNFQ